MPTSTPPQPEPTLTVNAEGQHVLEYLETTSAHLFLTGRAGTGKSTLLQHFRQTTSKKLVVLAPTGLAAVNVGGQTIHSFFGFRPGITLDKVRARSRRLRPQARVMLLNNDPEGRWINGDLGLIETLPGADHPDQAVTVRLDRGKQVAVMRYTWEVIRFRYNSERDRIESEVMGSFTQYLLRLAWAVTIHKAQGKTFGEVVVDFGRGTFAPGQAYVALSRCTSMDGLVRRRPLEQQHVLADERIETFIRQPAVETAQQQVPL